MRGTTREDAANSPGSRRPFVCVASFSTTRRQPRPPYPIHNPSNRTCSPSAVRFRKFTSPLCRHCSMHIRGLKVVAHANPDLAALLPHQPLVRLRTVIPDVPKPLCPRPQWPGYAPRDHARPRIHRRRHAAMRDRTPAGHPQRPPQQQLPPLDIHLARDQRIVRQNHLARTGVLRKMLEKEVELPVQAVAPAGRGAPAKRPFATAVRPGQLASRPRLAPGAVPPLRPTPRPPERAQACRRPTRRHPAASGRCSAPAAPASPSAARRARHSAETRTGRSPIRATSSSQSSCLAPCPHARGDGPQHLDRTAQRT